MDFILFIGQVFLCLHWQRTSLNLLQLLDTLASHEFLLLLSQYFV